MVSNRRVSDRVVRRLPVRFWRAGEARPISGYTTNISATGMFVVTQQPAPKGARVRVEIEDPRCGFVVETEVAHAHKVSVDLSALGPSGMGLRFVPIEALVRELFPRADRTGAQPILKPQDPPPAAAPAARVTVPPNRVPIVRPLAVPAAPATIVRSPIVVRFSSVEQFLAVYERDLRQGGLFVSTAEPARIGDAVEIELHLPEPLSGHVLLQARVVHRIDSREGVGMEGPNLLAGIGVELIDSKRALAVLQPYLLGARPPS